MLRTYPMIVIAFLLGVKAPRAEADFIVLPSWDLTSAAVELSGPYDGHSFTTSQNPFHDSHAVAINTGAAQAQYDFEWAAEFGTFLIQASHEAVDVGGSGLFSSSSGRIWLETDADLPIDIHGSCTYNTPATYFDVVLAVTISRDDPYEALFNEVRIGGPFSGHPPVDTLTIDGDVILPAGDTYEIEYTMEIFSFGGATGILGTGSGFVDFQITPEPCTLALLAIFIVIVPRRRHCRLEVSTDG